MRRNAVCILICIFFLFSSSAYATEDPTISIVIDGETIILTDANGNQLHPIVSNGTVYFPINIFSEVLDYTIAQDIFTRSIVLSSPKDMDSESSQSIAEQFDVIITHNDGTVEKTTLQNVLNVLAGNSLKFEKDYQGASIVAYGKVQKIGGRTNLSGHTVKGYVCVGFFDASQHPGGWPMNCWEVEASEEDLAFVSELAIGDTVKVSGVIRSGFGSSIKVYIANGNTTKIEAYTGTLE